MQGTYVEIGVNTCGAYGSNATPPAGYHLPILSGLGFVADSDQDGWDVGTPEYCGDYFVYRVHLWKDGRSRLTELHGPIQISFAGQGSAGDVVS